MSRPPFPRRPAATAAPRAAASPPTGLTGAAPPTEPSPAAAPPHNGVLPPGAATSSGFTTDTPAVHCTGS